MFETWLEKAVLHGSSSCLCLRGRGWEKEEAAFAAGVQGSVGGAPFPLHSVTLTVLLSCRSGGSGKSKSSWHMASAGCETSLSITFSSSSRAGVGELPSLDWGAPGMAMACWASPAVSSVKELFWKPWVASIP